MRVRISQRELAEAVAELVESTDWVTFNQISQFLERLHVPSRGELNLSMSMDRNVLLWSGMSEEMSEVLVELMDQKRIFAHRSTVAAYHVQGGVLGLPLAESPRAGGLHHPHWLPVAFRAVPPPFALH